MEIENSGKLKNNSATTVGPYTLVQEIGSGGEAKVYYAIDNAKNEFAVKVFKEEENMQEQWMAIKGIFAITNKVFEDCPTILKIQSIMRTQQLVEPGQPVRRPNILVMEYLKHGTLHRFVTHHGVNGRLPERIARRFFKDIVDAVKAMHTQNLAHLDIKHINVLVNNECQAVVIDLGMLDDCEKDLTILKGTKEWRDPSLVEGEPYNPKHADIYSMALLLHSMVAGTPLIIDDYAKFLQNKERWWDDYRRSTQHRFPDLHFSQSYIELMNGMLEARPKRWTIDQIVNSNWLISPNVAQSINIENQLLQLKTESRPVIIRNPKINKAKDAKRRQDYFKTNRAALSMSSILSDLYIPFLELKKDVIPLKSDIIVNDVELGTLKMALLDLKEHFKNSNENLLIFDTVRQELEYRVVKTKDSYEVLQYTTQIQVTCALINNYMSSHGNSSPVLTRIELGRDKDSNVVVRVMPGNRNSLADCKLCYMVQMWCEAFEDASHEKEQEATQMSELTEGLSSLGINQGHKQQ